LGINITCAIECNYREAATLYTLVTWLHIHQINMVCLKYIIVNTIIKVIGDDNNNTLNVKTKMVPVIGGVTGTISESFR